MRGRARNRMANEQERPLLVLLTSHWISMLGAALVTLAGSSWLFVLPAHIRGHVDNPYIGLLIFVIIPVVFFAGLALIPVGIMLAKRRIAAGLAVVQDRKTAWRRVAVFFVVMTALNVIIGSQGSYRAVQHMETVQFCGQTCHVAPGASGWVKSKMAGTRQLMGVVFNTYPRPIESAMESDRLTPSAETCEQC